MIQLIFASHLIVHSMTNLKIHSSLLVKLLVFSHLSDDLSFLAMLTIILISLLFASSICHRKCIISSIASLLMSLSLLASEFKMTFKIIICIILNFLILS